MIFRTDRKRLPWRTDGSRDLIAPELLKKDGRFRRVELGGRPTELAFAPDGKTALRRQLPADADPGRRRRVGQAGPDDPPGRAQRPCRSRGAARSCSTTPTRSHQPVVQLQHLPQRRAHQRPRLRHAQRRPAGPEHRPPAQPQEGPDAPPRHPDQALDLARLADQPRRRDGRVVHQEHAGPQAQGRRRQSAGRLSGHARISQEPLPQPDGSLTPGRPARPGRLPLAPRPPATPATAAPSSPTARSTRSGSKSATTPIAATIPPRSAASTTKTPTSTTAAPRPCAMP